MNNKKKPKLHLQNVIVRFKHNVRWGVVLFLFVILNLLTLLDGDFFNWKMNLGLLIFVIVAAFYDNVKYMGKFAMKFSRNLIKRTEYE
jgi:hypothetical protein